MKNSFFRLVVLICIFLFAAYSHGDAQEAQEADDIAGIAWSPAGDKIAVGSWGGVLEIRDAASGEVLRMFQPSLIRISALSWRADGVQIAAGGLEGIVSLYDVVTGRWVRSLRQEDVVDALYWVSDDLLLSTNAGSVGVPTLQGWDPITGERTFAADAGYYISIVPNQDHTQLLMQNFAGISALWSSDPLSLVREFGNWETGKDFAMSADWSTGNLIAIGTENGRVRIWDVTDAELLYDLPATDAAMNDLPRDSTIIIWAVQFSADGTQLTSVCKDGTLRIWNVTTGEMVEDIRLEYSPIYAAAFSPDGKYLAYGGIGSEIHVVER
ncbi:MAG TPA: hypothetical protein VHP83_08625 [Aggregatilineaceae bacterium]|nr:hypothetical protein [Aggregatilineaceae bacterium]